jgi:glutamate dehydrogenase/leucine dehydrogenase
MHPVQIRKLEKTNGFVAIDLPDAQLAVGPTRLAPKILQDGAVLLARSITYTFASFGLRHSGGTAGINTGPDERDDALTAYMEEVAPLVHDRHWLTWPGTGVTDDDLKPLRVVEGPRPDDPTDAAAGAVAAAGELAGERVVIVGSGPVVDAARRAIEQASANVVEGGIDADCHAVFLAGKAGMVDHEIAETIKAPLVVPLTALPITTKAYAVLNRAGKTYIPDFVALAAPLLRSLDAGNGDPVARVRDLTAELAPAGPTTWMAACQRAEAFLQTWQDTLPFGRPLA